MTRKALDPNLASILDSIRATVGGEPTPRPAPAIELVEPEPEPEVAVAPEPEPAKPAKGSRKATAAPAPAATAPFAPAPAGSPGSRTVEEFLAELIRPQLDAWLKANLPELIQKMAADEIARLTGRR
jgi:cell pole-organizing protein PopZ